MRSLSQHFLFALMFSLSYTFCFFSSAWAFPSTQTDDPDAACARGVELSSAGQWEQALPLLEAGFAGLVEGDFETSEDLGICAYLLGIARNNAGDRSGALEAYTVALKVFQASRNSEMEENILLNIGVVYRQQGRFQEAREAYEKALVIARSLNDRVIIGRALNNIGVLYNQIGRFEDALEYYRQALEIRREAGDRIGEGITLNNMGEVYRNQGRYGEALEAYQQALVVAQSENNQSGEGNILNNMGLVFNARGQFDEALIHYQMALEIWRETENLSEQGNTLHNIGYSIQLQGRYDEALEYYQQALPIRRKVEDRFGEGITLNNVGEVYSSQERFTDALDTLEQALKIAREVGDRVGEGTTLNNIGLALDALDQNEEALKSYQESLDIRREVGDLHGLSITLFNIGVVYQDLGQTEQAIKYFEQAMNELEGLRAISGSEQARSSFIAQYSNVYQRSVELYFRTERFEAAFFSSERARARAFLDSLATGHVQLAEDEATSLYEAEQEAYAVRQAAKDALTQARENDSSDREIIAELEAQVEAAIKDHQDVLQTIEARKDQLADLIPGRSAILDIEEVQTLLDEGTTLLSFFLLDEGAVAFLVTQDKFEAVDLPEATPDNLRSAVTDLHKWINRDNPHPLPLQNLHKWLVGPLLGRIQTPRVGIIPHQILHYVPFAALTDGQTYFGEPYSLFVLPSASAYKFIQQNAQGASKITGLPPLVFGNPDASDRDLAPLLHAESEANQVAAILETSAFTNGNASEEQFWKEANKAEIIHLAAHGSFDETNPLLSAVHLASGGEFDGRLEVQEVFRLDLTATDLVTLSACQTNVGELSTGDEVVGLTRAFFFAGSPTTLSSLWNVDDEATANLMVAFYRYLLEGESMAEALRAAQAEVRESHPSPFFWAGFVLSGDPGPEPEENIISPETQVTPELEAIPQEEPRGWLCSSAIVALLIGVYSISFRGRILRPGL